MKYFGDYLVISNKLINNNNVYELLLEGKSNNIEPGQFVNVSIPGKMLPRPFSVAHTNNYDLLYIVYRVVGSGTEILSTMKRDDVLKLHTGLGNGYDLSVKTEKPLLIGGGTGVASLYDLALKLKDPKVILGFKSKEDSIYVDKFKSKFQTLVSYETNTDFKYVTDYIKEMNKSKYPLYDYYYACGPRGMLEAINDVALTDGEYSLESHMACGVGACKCCSIETNEGMKSLCKDGPVLKKKLVKW